MIIVHGHIETTAENLNAALELSRNHVMRSRGESGCISHNAHIDVDNPNRIVFFEEWESMQFLRTHFAVPESGTFVAQVSELSIGPPILRIFDASEIQLTA